MYTFVVGSVLITNARMSIVTDGLIQHTQVSDLQYRSLYFAAKGLGAGGDKLERDDQLLNPTNAIP